jgi:hypothetical protein
MNYTVIWTERTEQLLAAAWLAASNRNEVTVAAHELELELRRDPLNLGESRRSSVDRIAVHLPLGISFNVVVDDLTAYVTAVWLIV